MSLVLDYLFLNAEKHFGRNMPVDCLLLSPSGGVVRVSIDLFTSFAEIQSHAPLPLVVRPVGFLLNQAMQRKVWAVRRAVS
jgi:hypothetical protein